MDSFWERLTLRDLQASFDAEHMAYALQLVVAKQVENIELDGDETLSGEVTDGRKRNQVSIVPRKNSLNMMCSCGGMKEGPCVHALALMAAWATAETDNISEMSVLSAPSMTGEQLVVQPASQPALFQSAGPAEIRADWQNRLNGLTVKEMRELAGAYRVKLKGTLRDQVLEGLLAALAEPRALQEALERLRPDARRVLDLLCALADLSPRFNTAQVVPYLEAALGNGLKARPVEECLADLRGLGLFIEPGYSIFYPVPLLALAQPLANPGLFKPFDGEPGRVTAAQPFQFTRLALRLLLLSAAGLLHCIPLKGEKKNHWPLPANADQGSAELEIYPEPAYLEGALRAGLAKSLSLPAEQVDLAARLLEADRFWPSRAPEKLTTHIEDWLQLNPQEQSRRLFARAVSLPGQLELDLSRQAGFIPWRYSRVTLNYKDFLEGLNRARQRLARLLARVPGGQWVEIESILRTVHGLQPGWTMEYSSRQGDPVSKRSWENTPAWVAVGRRRLDPLRYDDWVKSYGQLHLAFLTGTFSWLGLVDVGWQGDQPVAVRLAEFGEYLLGRRDDFPLPAPASRAPALTVRPDWTLELDLETAPLDLVNLLVQVAAPVPGGKPEARRLAYQLTDSGLGRAYEAGWKLEEVEARLAEACGAPLPPRLLEKMRPLWERFGRLQIYEDMTLIEFADDFCLPELLASTSLSQILLTTFSSRLVAVRTSSAGDFIAELQAKGYTPRLEGEAHG